MGSETIFEPPSPEPKTEPETKGDALIDTEDATIDINKDGKADVSAQFLIISTLVGVSILLLFIMTLLLTGAVTWDQVMELVDKAGMAITGALGMGLGAGGAAVMKRK